MIAAPVYARARAAGIPATHAAGIARAVAPSVPVPEYGAPVALDPVNGYTLRASLSDDVGLDLADMGYGRFADGAEDWRTGYPSRPDPDAVPNPYRDSRNPSGGARWYIPGAAGTVRERAAYYHEHGASRAVAWDLARASVADELRAVTTDYGPSAYVVTVTAARAGVVLGRASVGGVVLEWDPITRTNGAAYLAETVADLIPEAVAEAAATLAKLCA